MPASPSPFVLALGDSLVAGYGLPLRDGFAAQLERALRASHPNALVRNAGVSGSTSEDVRRRLPAVLSTLETRPDLAIVQVGPNDVLRQVPPALTRSNIEAVLVELNRCGVPALLTEVEPPAILRDRAAAYTGLHRELAERYGAATAPFFPPGTLGHTDLVLPDRVHPNARAIALVVEGLLPVVQELLAGPRRTSPSS